MRERSLVAILGLAGVVVVAAILGVVSLRGDRSETASPSIVIEIPDNPAALAATEVEIDIPDNPAARAATEAQEAETVAMQPGAAEEPVQQQEEQTAEAPHELLIADAIRQRLEDPVLRKGHHADDIAAVESFYKDRSGPALWLTSAGISPRGQTVLGVLGKAEEWGLDPTLFRVPPAQYRPTAAEDQAATELAISLSALKYARAARGGLVDPTSISKVYGLSPKVRVPETVLTEVSTAPAPDAYLTGLHPKHEQFERLRQALPKAQSEEEDERLRSNMDRWRWMPETLGDSYVWLNIPEFKLHVLEDGKTVQSEKIVVGNPSTPTPVLSAEMTEIVFNPERIVPLSLIRKEVLPKLKGGNDFFGRTDTSVLDQYQITVKRRGQPVDPSTIDWKTVNPATLTFVQAPGRTNILGKVQFLYPNDRGVYLHDTIISSQLARAVRAEGNKEPRVGNPDRVAARLLAKSNGMSGAKVNQLVGGGTTSRVKLDTPITIHMTYFTAVVDEQGKVQTFNDVYKLDGRGKPDDAAAASPAPAAGTAPIPSRKPVNRNLATTVP